MPTFKVYMRSGSGVNKVYTVRAKNKRAAEKAVKEHKGSLVK